DGVIGLVLAAGASTRMGPTNNKLVEEVDGRAIVRRPVEAMLEAGVPTVLVVAGFEAERVEAALAGLACRVLRQAGWPARRRSALAVGARADARRGPSALLVCVGDLPGLRAEHVRPLLDAVPEAELARRIVVPTHAGRRAHPVLFGASFLPALEALEGEVGGRAVIEANPAAVVEVAIADDAGLRDVDTPEALRAARAPKTTPV
ncbi:MAG: nucleotidyltransferase family protein, partial [Myxococcales bacterium]|nr:nucleotidyltransferase family protein [Myxococcales bacterium]